MAAMFGSQIIRIFDRICEVSAGYAGQKSINSPSPSLSFAPVQKVPAPCRVVCAGDTPVRCEPYPIKIQILNSI
jgi:hypothetical protein